MSKGEQWVQATSRPGCPRRVRRHIAPLVLPVLMSCGWVSGPDWVAGTAAIHGFDAPTVASAGSPLEIGVAVGLPNSCWEFDEILVTRADPRVEVEARIQRPPPSVHWGCRELYTIETHPLVLSPPFRDSLVLIGQFYGDSITRRVILIE